MTDTINPPAATDPAATPKTTRAKLTGRARKSATDPAVTPADSGDGAPPSDMAAAASPAGDEEGPKKASRWKCSLPDDKLIPASLIEASDEEFEITEAEARERYKQIQGIYFTPHEILAEPIE
jgi:hypothetical protein